MKKIDKLRKQLRSIESEINALDNFRDSTIIRKLRRNLQGELNTTNEEIRKLTESKKENEIRKQEKLKKANRNRSAKNKRVWNYVKSIRDNYRPDLSVKEIRSQLKKHRHGLETDIPDVAWRNPSP